MIFENLKEKMEYYRSLAGSANPPESISECQKKTLLGRDIYENWLFYDPTKGKSYLRNPAINFNKIRANKFYVIYIRDTDRACYLDWVENSANSWLRNYKTPGGRDKELVDKMIAIYLSDPDYPMTQFVYDVLTFSDYEEDDGDEFLL